MEGFYYSPVSRGKGSFASDSGGAPILRLQNQQRAFCNVALLTRVSEVQKVARSSY